MAKITGKTKSLLLQVMDFAGISVGAALFALGTQGFVVAVKLGGGGVSGLALLSFYLWAIPIGMTTILLNIPLLIVGWQELGRRFILRTAYGVFVSSIFLDLFKGLNFVPTGDVLLGALFGGVVQGIGGALVFRFEGSLGGMDIVAKILQRRYGYSIGNTGLVASIVVIGASVAILGPVVAMYTLVSLYVSSKVLDAILEGIPAKSAMIISEYGELLAQKIMADAGRGVTVVKGRGAYTMGDKDVLICVVALSELVRLKRLVKETDPNAFVIVNDAKEVLGKGFAQLG
ncbi:MAG TPA: YitT family protein [Verrucomicrobiae bacterium]|nr:YitT family protein [Verrucomicrobiae bacterium]